jgi:hypothetical protein
MGASSAVSLGPSTRGTRVASVLAACALLAGLASAPGANGARTASLSVNVTFSASGAVTVTLADGTPLGTTSGAPTVIPAGFYTVSLAGPGECINLPLWTLKGPGVNLEDDMRGGEVEHNTLYATFLPNTTYTWHLDRSASIVHTFRTSGDVVGTQTSTPAPTPKTSSTKPTHVDIVGSLVLPFRGTLTAAVSASGRLTLAFKGKSVASLKAGRYTIKVTDESSTNGLLVEKLTKKPTTVTGTAFVGKRTATLRLTAGKWLFLEHAGKPTYSVDVR